MDLHYRVHQIFKKDEEIVLTAIENEEFALVSASTS